MATRSTIWLKDSKTNEIRGIYCHWDGYPQHVGRILKEYYNTEEKVQELINLGAISSLRENISTEDESHSFNNPVENVTVAYHRDRGEELQIYNELDEEFFEEYNYIFEDNQWFLLEDEDRVEYTF